MQIHALFESNYNTQMEKILNIEIAEKGNVNLNY